MTEVWRPVEGFPLYLVSSEGRVWSVMRGRCLVPVPDSGGYLRVTLRQDGRAVTRAVHVLVCQAFYGPRPAGYHACHGPAGQLVNTVENLRWDTPQENERDKQRNRKGRRGQGKNGRGRKGKQYRKGSQGRTGHLFVAGPVT